MTTRYVYELPEILADLCTRINVLEAAVGFFSGNPGAGDGWTFDEYWRTWGFADMFETQWPVCATNGRIVTADSRVWIGQFVIPPSPPPYELIDAGDVVAIGLCAQDGDVRVDIGGGLDAPLYSVMGWSAEYVVIQSHVGGAQFSVSRAQEPSVEYNYGYSYPPDPCFFEGRMAKVKQRPVAADFRGTMVGYNMWDTLPGYGSWGEIPHRVRYNTFGSMREIYCFEPLAEQSFVGTLLNVMAGALVYKLGSDIGYPLVQSNWSDPALPAHHDIWQAIDAIRIAVEALE